MPLSEDPKEAFALVGADDADIKKANAEATLILDANYDLYRIVRQTTNFAKIKLGFHTHEIANYHNQYPDLVKNSLKLTQYYLRGIVNWASEPGEENDKLRDAMDVESEKVSQKFKDNLKEGLEKREYIEIELSLDERMDCDIF